MNGAGGRPSFQKEREGLAAGSRAQKQTAHAVLSQWATPPHTGSLLTLMMPGVGICLGFTSPFLLFHLSN